MVSNMIFDIFEHFQISTKSETSDPLSIAEMLQEIQDKYQIIWDIIFFCKSANLYILEDVGTCTYQAFRNVASWISKF